MATTKPALVSGPEIELRENEIAHDDIAALAHRLWHDRGCPFGSPEEDWFEAQRRLSSPVEAATENKPTTAG